MNANFAALLYLVSGILFILALRGLSSPATSRQGNRFGMIGMGVAVLTTLAVRPPSSAFSWLLIILGVAIGVASAYGLTRILASFLFGVTARDPVVFVSVPMVLSGVALLGVWLPARRAARVDPVVALRTE